jgi:hypothetical protein
LKLKLKNVEVAIKLEDLELKIANSSQIGASTRKWGSQCKLREVEPSFKEFLASPAMMHLGLFGVN